MENGYVAWPQNTTCKPQKQINMKNENQVLTENKAMQYKPLLPAVHSRQLEDRIEKYSSIIIGKCSCDEPINKVLNSSCTNYVNGDRYHYPYDNTAWCIFRCKKCHKPIHETFKPC